MEKMLFEISGSGSGSGSGAEVGSNRRSANKNEEAVPVVTSTFATPVASCVTPVASCDPICNVLSSTGECRIFSLRLALDFSILVDLALRTEISGIGAPDVG